MRAIVEEVVQKVRSLSDIDKISLIDELMSQLDKPDPELDKIWADEARKRWQAYREGRVAELPYSEVMAKYRRA